MRERKKAGSGWGPRAMSFGAYQSNRRDTPEQLLEVREAMMGATVVLKSVAGALLRAVRRSAGTPPPAADSHRFLTIGALTVVTPEPPVVPGVPTTRRSLAYTAILQLAADLITSRFVVVRALDRMSTHDVLELLDEVAETVDGAVADGRRLHVTPRNQIPD